MLTDPCDYPDCSAWALPVAGDCERCRKHLCTHHNLPPTHLCGEIGWTYEGQMSPLDQENARMQTSLNDLGIERSALELRPGHTLKPICLVVDSLPRGMFNIIVPIEFDDGVKWVARVRRKTFFQLPSRVVRMCTQGEIDTMKWLARVDAAPVPKIVSPLYTHGDTDFYFMEMITGTSFPDPLPTGDDRLSLIRTTIWDYAKISIRRSLHPLRLVGTLYHDPIADAFSVGPHLNFFIPNQAIPHFPGPWKTTAQKYAQRFDDILADIRAGTLYPDDREQAFLVHRWMKEVVVAYPPYQHEEDTFIVHEDSNAGMIMVDVEGKITGLIDWERASVGSKVEAFATPAAFEDRSLILTGSNDLSFAEVELVTAYTELGRPDLAECIVLGKPFQWLSMILGAEDWKLYKYLKALGVSLGLEMEDSMAGFLEVQKGKYEEELGFLGGQA
ncbi:uncharacterized protein MKK02DRAFT_38164 [Dioszegia hungarica]|uniref:Aminoglycoside phosphotransferase domain-containing protein n=1 Tax=Dioszegia hungarica TaxID=4972 RepID=A0AA38LU64_9TREE|nr:uncharacterized protein MKK02DRAFT_38164 [Dioszegia hungarica]KAI9633511.1 hypothetical protein MKK02DRAFT_38164 [Dioszegia hungarica]